VDDLWMVECQLEGDGAAVGVPDDVRPLHAQVAQQRPRVGGLAGDADRLGWRVTAHIAATAVADEPVAVRQAGLG
jgi:hypothetical protein